MSDSGSDLERGRIRGGPVRNTGFVSRQCSPYDRPHSANRPAEAVHGNVRGIKAQGAAQAIRGGPRASSRPLERLFTRDIPAAARRVQSDANINAPLNNAQNILTQPTTAPQKVNASFVAPLDERHVNTLKDGFRRPPSYATLNRSDEVSPYSNLGTLSGNPGFAYRIGPPLPLTLGAAVHPAKANSQIPQALPAYLPLRNDVPRSGQQSQIPHQAMHAIPMNGFPLPTASDNSKASVSSQIPTLYSCPGCSLSFQIVQTVEIQNIMRQTERVKAINRQNNNQLLQGHKDLKEREERIDSREHGLHADWVNKIDEVDRREHAISEREREHVEKMGELHKQESYQDTREKELEAREVALLEGEQELAEAKHKANRERSADQKAVEE